MLPIRSRHRQRDVFRLLGIAAALKLAVHLYAARGYGYFIDELYYLACARHLAWGYVDQPPLIAFLAWIAGDSLFGIRFAAALAGVATVLLAGLAAREFGGGAFAVGLAGLATLAAPGILASHSLFTMNAFEPLFWTGAAWTLIRIIKTDNQRLWILFGVIAGAGLLNKHSMLIFGFGLAAGLLLTAERRMFKSRGPWIAAAIALAIFAPNLWWNYTHDFPFLEIQANIRADGRNAELPLLRFLGEVALVMLPLSAPVWIAGFVQLWRQFRALAWACAITAVLIFVLNPRVYYVFPLFPLLFAAGAVWWEPRLRPAAIRWVAGTAILLMGAILAPLGAPLLAPETFIRYRDTLGIDQPRIENGALGPLPQLFADQFGWEELAAEIARIYRALPDDVRPRTAIFGQDYGQAGAIDLLGPKYGLPPAISAHQNYFLWGHRDYTGESMIIMDDTEDRLRELFGDVEKVGRVSHPYSMPTRRFDVFYCREPRIPLAELWPRIKNWR